MNMRSLTVILGALTTFALGACKVTTTTGSTGGSTSATGTGGEAAGVGGAGGSTTASTGTSACDATLTCAGALDGDPSMLCEGASAELYDKYYACTCETGGKCVAACGDNACKDGAKTDDCTKCLQDSAAGCATEFEACSGDI